MTEIQVRPKADKRIAWQYHNGNEKWPKWVENNTFINPIGELILNRQSGNQVIEIGEWLIKEIDGGISWCRNDDMWNVWEKV